MSEPLRKEVERLFNGRDERFSRRHDGVLVVDHWCDGDENEAKRVAMKSRKLIALTMKDST